MTTKTTNRNIQFYALVLMGIVTFILGIAFLAVSINLALKPNNSLFRVVPLFIFVLLVWVCAAMFGRLALTIEKI